MPSKNGPYHHLAIVRFQLTVAITTANSGNIAPLLWKHTLKYARCGLLVRAFFSDLSPLFTGLFVYACLNGGGPELDKRAQSLSHSASFGEISSRII